MYKCNTGLRYKCNTGLRYKCNTGLQYKRNTGLQYTGNTGLQYTGNTGLQYTGNTGLQYKRNTGLQYTGNTFHIRFTPFWNQFCSHNTDKTGWSTSLKHQWPQVFVEYRVLDVLKHEFDVLRVDGRGEVVEEGLGALPAAGIEAL